MADKSLAFTVVGLAGFQLLSAWNANAPSLADMRDSPPGDPEMKRKLMDADIMVGGTALILGGAVWALTGDSTALGIMAAMFCSVSIWHHIVLEQGNTNPGNVVTTWL